MCEGKLFKILTEFRVGKFVVPATKIKNEINKCLLENCYCTTFHSNRLKLLLTIRNEVH